MVIRLFTTDWFAWSNSNRSQFSNVFIDVAVSVVRAGPDTSFGIMCNYVDSDNYYYVGIDSDGYYAIIQYAAGTDTFLTGGGQWVQSDLITPNAGFYQLGAACANDFMALYVDGQLIDSAGVSGQTTSDVGVFAWTNESSDEEIRFDNFSVSALP